MGRLASGMATDRTEVTGEDGGPMQFEITAALNKIYGEILDVTDDRRPRPPVDDRQIVLLPKGDCTDAPGPPGGASATRHCPLPAAKPWQNRQRPRPMNSLEHYLARTARAVPATK